jgi:protein-tyrosine phosphatase
MIIDSHCHIIPFIDDGAKDMNDFVEMCRIAEQDGTNGIIATPHYIHGVFNNNRDIVRKKVDELNGHLRRLNISIELYTGSEAFICPELPQLVREGDVSTLNNSRYVMLELPMDSIPDYTDDIIYRLQLDGCVPIIAHPERNEIIMKNPNLMYDFIQRGALSQVNTTSVRGLFGKEVQDTVISLLKHNMVHLLASDAHTTGGRSPKLAAAMDIIERTAGKAVLLAIVKNGEALVVDQPIYIEEPMPFEEEKHGFSSVLRGLFQRS